MCALPPHGLVRGNVGATVLVHGNGEAFEAEFADCDGHAIALLIYDRSQVRPLVSRDILRARTQRFGSAAPLKWHELRPYAIDAVPLFRIFQCAYFPAKWY